MNIPELEQLVLRAVGLEGRDDVAGVTFHFTPQEAPKVIVGFLVTNPSHALGEVLAYLAEHYTLVPCEPPATSESAQ